jgi:hypothetical protein
MISDLDLTKPKNIEEMHKLAEEGDEETIKFFLENAEDAITYEREEAWTKFFSLWYDRIKIASRHLYRSEKVQRLIRLLLWYDRLFGIPPISFEYLIDECALGTFEKLLRIKKPFDGRTYGEMKNYLRIAINWVMMDKIRKLLNQRQPTPLELQKKLKDLPDDLQSMKKNAVAIFAKEERYKEILQRRWLNKSSRSMRLERMKYYYEIVRLSLKGKSPAEIEKLLLRKFGSLPKDMGGLKREAFQEIWLNICIDEELHELKNYIISTVILKR